MDLFSIFASLLSPVSVPNFFFSGSCIFYLTKVHGLFTLHILMVKNFALGSQTILNMCTCACSDAMITVFAGSDFMPNFALFWSSCTDLSMLMNMVVAM